MLDFKSLLYGCMVLCNWEVLDVAGVGMLDDFLSLKFKRNQYLRLENVFAILLASFIGSTSKPLKHPSEHPKNF